MTRLDVRNTVSQVTFTGRERIDGKLIRKTDTVADLRSLNAMKQR